MVIENIGETRKKPLSLGKKISIGIVGFLAFGFAADPLYDASAGPDKPLSQPVDWNDANAWLFPSVSDNFMPADMFRRWVHGELDSPPPAPVTPVLPATEGAIGNIALGEL